MFTLLEIDALEVVRDTNNNKNYLSLLQPYTYMLYTEFSNDCAFVGRIWQTAHLTKYAARLLKCAHSISLHTCAALVSFSSLEL